MSPPAPVCWRCSRREQHGLVSEAGGGVVRLVAAGADRRDRVIVVAGRDQQAAGGERDEVARLVVRPRPGEPEVGDRHDDQRAGGQRRWRARSSPRCAQPAGMHGDDEHVGGRRAGDRASARPSSPLEVDDDAALAAVVVPEGEAAIGVGLDRRRTGRRAATGAPSGGSTLITSAPRLTNCNPVISPPGSSDSSTTVRPAYGVVADVGEAATQITPRSVRSAISSALEPRIVP